MRKVVAGAVVLSVSLLLVGCGETWEQLAENKERCEELGGTFTQHQDGLVYADHSRCDFNDEVAE